MLHCSIYQCPQAINELDAADGLVVKQPCPISLTLANHPQSLNLEYVCFGPIWDGRQYNSLQLFAARHVMHLLSCCPTIRPLTHNQPFILPSCGKLNELRNVCLHLAVGRLTIPDGQFPIPDGQFSIPDGQFPIPDGQFTIPADTNCCL